jgi:lysophospholipase L1-like esterase
MSTPQIFILTIAIAIVTYILYVGVPIYQAIQEGKQLMSQAVPYEQHPVQPTQYFLVTGDSTAVGTGASTSTESTAGRLGQQFPSADITNVSENGLTLERLMQKLPALPDKHYDLVLIQIGANDIVKFTSYSDVRSRLDTVLNWAQAHSTRTLVLTAGDDGLAPVFHFPLPQIYTHRTLEIRKIFMTEIGKYLSITYIDFYKNKEDEPFNKNIPLYYAPDHFHPSSAGYGIWYTGIQAALASK